MSELVASQEMDNATEKETMAELEKRHKAEVRKLEGEVRALLKTAKKSTKAQIETQIIRMQYDLKERHQEEYDALESAGGDGGATAFVDNVPTKDNADNNSDNDSELKTEEEIAAAKKAKAKKKQVWKEVYSK